VKPKQQQKQPEQQQSLGQVQLGYRKMTNQSMTPDRIGAPLAM
jgi:hypothetical protein